MADPFPKVAGGGIARLRAAGLTVELGLESAAAHCLNAPYLKRLATGQPYVTAKWAMTLDGKIATHSGDSAWISGPRSRALVHELRGRVDAVVVGIGTALADDSRLTARPAGPRVATRVVLDSEARLPLESRLIRSAREVPVLVAVTERSRPERRAALCEAGCDILVYASETVPIDLLLTELGLRGATNVLVEGGGRVLGAFFDAGQVDEVDIYLAPIVLGGTHDVSPVLGNGPARLADALRLNPTRISQVDSDVRFQASVPRPWRGADHS
jgi:diaminohydroxyphosphoribosylaminopyrimidine deaminase/5-amino-6-(5-phosphoribosylamino)uracil reductase